MKCSDDIDKSSMSHNQRNRCPLCRTTYPSSGQESIEQLRPWVEKGKAWAQSLLGDRYRVGLGVDQSDQRAIAFYKLAAIQGEAHAQYHLGVMYSRVHPLAVRAAECFEAAANQGMAQAQCSMGHLYANGEGVKQSIETARVWYLKAAEQGLEMAIEMLQKLDEMEGRTTPSFVPPKRCTTCDVPETPSHKLNNCPCFGAQYCNAKCQTSHWKCHKKEHRRLRREMKKVVVEEEGEKKETTTADSQQQEEEKEDVCPVCIEVLQKDAKKFARYTCCGKGIHKWCNEGIKASSLSDKQKRNCPLCRTKYPTSNEEIIEQLLPWVEKGKAWAQTLLGHRYEDGLGVDQSYQRAAELFEAAARQGDASAQYNLGVMFKDGQGVDQSYEKAAEYYEAAAKQGDANAQYSLGILYVNGQGVEKSIETGRAWLMKVAAQGLENAIGALQQLDKIEGRTTPSFVPKPLECAFCYRPHDPPEHKLRPCQRCRRVFYCGKECQVRHWKQERGGHKQLCNKKGVLHKKSNDKRTQRTKKKKR